MECEDFEPNIINILVPSKLCSLYAPVSSASSHVSEFVEQYELYMTQSLLQQYKTQINMR